MPNISDANKRIVSSERNLRSLTHPYSHQVLAQYHAPIFPDKLVDCHQKEWNDRVLVIVVCEAGSYRGLAPR